MCRSRFYDPSLEVKRGESNQRVVIGRCLPALQNRPQIGLEASTHAINIRHPPVNTSFLVILRQNKVCLQRVRY